MKIFYKDYSFIFIKYKYAHVRAHARIYRARL